MKVKAKDTLRRQLENLLERIRVSKPPKRPEPTRVTLSAPNMSRVLLGDSDSSEYFEVLRCLQTRYSGGRIPDISERRVEALLKTAILNALGPSGQGQMHRTNVFAQRKSEAVEQLLATLDSAVGTWKVYVPVPAPSVRRTRRFGKVTFLAPGSQQARSLAQSLKAPRGSNVTSHLCSSLLALVTVLAKDGEAARNKGVQEVRRTLDALDFVQPSLEAPYRDAALAFEPVQVVGSSAIVAVGPSHVSWQAHAFYPRVWSLDDISTCHPRLYRAVSRLLRLDSPGALQTRYATAVSWAGRAMTERRIDEAFLFHVIALESALTKDERASALTERVARRAALVHGGLYAERRRVFDDVKSLYSRRSKIVHSGAVDSLTKTDFEEAAACSRRLLGALLRRAPFCAMRDEDELEDWFSKREFGC